MKVTRSGTLFSFYFSDVHEIASYNAWVDEVEIKGAKVPVPHNRQARRIMTTQPSILNAVNQEAVDLITARWLVS